MNDRWGINYNAEYETEQRAIQVRIVIDVVIGLLALVPRKNKVKRSENKPGNADREVQVDFLKRVENNERKDDGSYTTGRPQRAVPRVILMLKERR